MVFVLLVVVYETEERGAIGGNTFVRLVAAGGNGNEVRWDGAQVQVCTPWGCTCMYLVSIVGVVFE